MKVKILNNYEQLHSCMLGDIDFSVLDSITHNRKQKLEYIFEQAHDDLNVYQKQLESYGVSVYRPKSFNSGKPLATPYYETIGHRIPLSPSDSFFIVDNTIIETSCWTAENAFAGMYWRDVTRSAFNDGSQWIPMPMPLHDENEVDPLDADIPNLDPIIDGPCMYLHDDTVLVSTVGASNTQGVKWIQTIFPNKKFIMLDANKFKGHLDAHMNILRPGLIATYHPREDFPDYFKNWDFITVEPASEPNKFIDSKIQDDDTENTVLACNSLSINTDTVLVESSVKHLNNNFLVQLEQYKFNIDFVNFPLQHFFGHGLSCMTIPLYREDNA